MSKKRHARAWTGAPEMTSDPDSKKGLQLVGQTWKMLLKAFKDCLIP